MRKIIPYGRQDITQADIDAVSKVLMSDFLTQGPKIEEFEKKFSDLVGCHYAISCSNATTGLQLAVNTLKKNEKKVLVSPITFVASSNCIIYNGLTPEFIDINPETFLIDLDKVEEKLKSNPNDYQGIIAITLAGYPLDYRRLKSICEKYGIWSIEDACHSPGAYRIYEDGTTARSGSSKYTDMAVFSFHPVKHIACGEGGMITTNNDAFNKRLNLLKSHGITKDPFDFIEDSHGGWYHEMQELGYNFRMTDIQAALGLSQLQRFSQNLEKRNEIASWYDDNLKKFDLKKPFREKNIFHAFHLYIIQTPHRDELYQYLRYRGIICQIHYIPIYKQPYYKKNFKMSESFNNSEEYYQSCLSLPMFSSLKHEDLKFIQANISDFFSSECKN